MFSGYRPLIAVALVLLIGGIAVARLQSPGAPNVAAARAAGCRQVAASYRSHVSDRWVILAARVSRILPDESGGRIHQRFIVRCASRQTVLIVNDVTLGGRVPERVGETAAIRGEYVWNPQGGLVHFTHHAEGGPAGWIAVEGHTYQ